MEAAHDHNSMPGRDMALVPDAMPCRSQHRHHACKLTCGATVGLLGPGWSCRSKLLNTYELLFMMTAVCSNQLRFARMVSWKPTDPFSPSPSRMNTKLTLQASGAVSAVGDLQHGPIQSTHCKRPARSRTPYIA
jgi:hypothetical protein